MRGTTGRVAALTPFGGGQGQVRFLMYSQALYSPRPDTFRSLAPLTHQQSLPENRLTRRPLPTRSADRARCWRLEGDEGGIRPLQGGLLAALANGGVG
jgi:hypothetical protein